MNDIKKAIIMAMLVLILSVPLVSAAFICYRYPKYTDTYFYSQGFTAITRVSGAVTYEIGTAWGFEWTDNTIGLHKLALVFENLTFAGTFDIYLTGVNYAQYDSDQYGNVSLANYEPGAFQGITACGSQWQDTTWVGTRVNNDTAGSHIYILNVTYTVIASNSLPIFAGIMLLPIKPGDINLDNKVNVIDAAAISASWNKKCDSKWQGDDYPNIPNRNYNPLADVSGGLSSCLINIADSARVGHYWNT